MHSDITSVSTSRYQALHVSLLSVLLIILAGSGPRMFCQINPDSAQVIKQLAQQAESDLHTGKLSEAAAVYQRILKLDPNNTSAHSNLGLAWYLRGEYTLAMGEFHTALRLEPDLWNIEALCGIAEAESGQNADAVAHLDQAFQHLREASLRMSVGRHLFSILFESGDLNRASYIIGQLQELEPTNVDILYAEHQVHSLLANRAFLSMARLAPDSARMYQLRGDQMVQAGNIAAAITAYQMAIDRDAHLSGAHFALAEVLRTSKSPAERAEAEAEYQRALAVNPQDEKAECRLGSIELERSNLQAAAQHFQRALKLQPSDAEANEGLGMVLMASNANGEAMTYLNQAVQLDPTDPTAWYHLSLASRNIGDMKAAAHAMEQFLSLKAQKDDLKRSFHDLRDEAKRQVGQEKGSGSGGAQETSVKMPPN